MAKIDFHVHVTPPGMIASWREYAEKEPYFSMVSNGKYNKFASAEDVLAVMEKENFGKAVIFGFGFRDIGLCRYVNDYVIEKVNQYPGQLAGFSVVPPCGKEAAREIERCYRAGLCGVGELFPAGQGIDLENEKETAAIAGTCRELGIPLLLHVNELVGHSYPGKTDVPLRQIETFVGNNPELKIVLAHWGGGLFFYETMKEIREKFKNVYYDTAITPFIYDERIYSIVKAMGLCKKILFGSDFPILPPPRYMDAIENSNLDEAEKRLILGENAEKLLKM